MSQCLDALQEAFNQAISYRLDLANRACAPQSTYHEMRDAFTEPLPENGSDDHVVIRQLVEKGEPGTSEFA